MNTFRVFIAIELPSPILVKIAELQERMKSNLPSGLVRWVRPEGIHLTLKFLGEVPVAQIEAISESMQAACSSHAPFTFSVGGMGCFPDLRRPNVVWVGVEEPSGALSRLHDDIERAMAPLGFPPEGRKFSPHLTLGRVKGGRLDSPAGAGALQALGDSVARARVSLGQVQATSVSLMRSDLLPGGAVYTELATAEL